MNIFSRKERIINTPANIANSVTTLLTYMGQENVHFKVTNSAPESNFEMR